MNDKAALDAMGKKDDENMELDEIEAKEGASHAKSRAVHQNLSDLKGSISADSSSKDQSKSAPAISPLRAAPSVYVSKEKGWNFEYLGLTKDYNSDVDSSQRGSLHFDGLYLGNTAVARPRETVAIL